MGPKHRENRFEERKGERLPLAQRRRQREIMDNDPGAKATKKGRPGKSKDDLMGGPPHARSRAKKYAVNPLKTRIRDLQRLLNKAENMPADVRMERERELAAVKHELAVAEAEQQKSKMIERYHMVRFFDRQKATRALKKITKQLNECTDPEQKADLRQKHHVAEVDLNYTMYFPLARAYVSLYPSKKHDDGKTRVDNEDTAQGIRGDIGMWEVIEKAMEEGTLDIIRNSLPMKVTTTGNAPPPAANEGRVRQSVKHLSADLMRKMKDTKMREREEDEESDGGFFEADGGVPLR